MMIRSYPGNEQQFANKEKSVENIVRKEYVTDYITTLNNLRENKFLDGFIWLKSQVLFVVFIIEVNERYILFNKLNNKEQYHWQEFSENFTLLNKNKDKTKLSKQQLSSLHYINSNKTYIKGKEELLSLFR